MFIDLNQDELSSIINCVLYKIQYYENLAKEQEHKEYAEEQYGKMYEIFVKLCNAHVAVAKKGD